MRMPIQRPTKYPFRQWPMMPNPMHHQPRGFGQLFSKLFGFGGNHAPFQGGIGFGSHGFNFPNMFGSGFQPGVGPQMFGGASGFSNLLGNFSSGGLPGMLNNIQKAIGIAQQIGPMVQQYGPFIKNMPAMLKMMKELNSIDSNETNDSENENSDSDEHMQHQEEQLFIHKTTNKPKELKTRPSKPKLYI
ncbi:hypothetical protein HR057_00830 [Bacillus sp. P2(2020)]|uniref:YqfQ-like protein n=2 Tax=Calidifontibacillus erzurumensis TaxID=2741433 RepID=A0A8J8GBU5_9BACI|nr:hypothetical protein [Calidifontibacillus erzurumensis]